MEGFVAAKQTEDMLFSLLSEWGRALVRLQDPLSGGICCPACGRVHGRCHEAAYPLLALAHRTGEPVYLAAAERLFDWGENVLRENGGTANDTDSAWQGVTAFAAISLHDALRFHGGLLSPEVRARWEARLSGMGEWICANITVGAHAYINYYAAGACALALLGEYFGRDGYRTAGRALAEYCFAHVSENGLLYGEGMPHNAVSPTGCRPVDIGYNAEESLPALLRWAEAENDAPALARCLELFAALLPFMLPDGAWDNSFGTRAFKWTYWGSRTSDGCTDALFRLGKTDPVFAEAAWRNLALLRRCTRGGLLAGGPDYAAWGEKICVHHTFCHAKALAAALDAGVYGFARTSLPAEEAPPVRFYPELGLYRLAWDGWLADISLYNAKARPGAYAAGGTLTLLWYKECGPVFAAGMPEYAPLEPHNQQLPLRPALHACPCPRLEAERGGVLYSNTYDKNARAITDGGAVRVRARLCGPEGEPLPDGDCALVYTPLPEGLRVEAVVSPETAARVRLVLPVIAPEIQVKVLCGGFAAAPEKRFCLTPGFIFTRYALAPDAQGQAEVLLAI